MWPGTLAKFQIGESAFNKVTNPAIVGVYSFENDKTPQSLVDPEVDAVAGRDDGHRGSGGVAAVPVAGLVGQVHGVGRLGKREAGTDQDRHRDRRQDGRAARPARGGN